MPVYEFYCSDCRSKFEVLTSYEASQSQMICATCHGANVRKLLSVFARPSHGGDDFGDFADGGDDFGDDGEGGGGCSCGGACSCNN
jgi:putative FmdB family regulatory protein